MTHPAFKTLHAHLCGAPELAGVASSSLTSLYPVEAQSYAPFLREFYEAKAGSLSKWDVLNAIPAIPHATLANAAVPGYMASPRNHRGYDDIHLIRVTGPWALELSPFLGGEIKYTFMKHLSRLMKTQYLLANWDAEGARSLKPLTLASLEEAIQSIASFYGAALDLDASTVQR